MRKSLLEPLTGALILIALTIVVVVGFAVGPGGSKGELKLIATFRQADGLSVGSAVYLAGVKVGKVASMTLEPKYFKARLVLQLEGSARVPTDSAAMIMSSGVLGSKYIKLEPGSADTVFKSGDQFEYVQDSVIVEKLLERIVRNAERRLKVGGTKFPKEEN